MIIDRFVGKSITIVIAILALSSLLFTFVAELSEMPKPCAYGNKLCEENITFIKECWLQLKTRAWICDHFKVSRYGLNKFLKDYNVNLYTEISDEALADVIRQFQQNNKETWGRDMIVAQLSIQNSMHFLIT